MERAVARSPTGALQSGALRSRSPGNAFAEHNDPLWNVGHLRTGNRDFVWLWAGQTLSTLGSQFFVFAMPLLAARTLNAGPRAFGLLIAANALPSVILSPAAGLIADWVESRRLLIVQELFLATSLLTVPMSAALHQLSVGVLVVVQLLIGAASLISVATQPLLRSIIPTTRLPKANARMEAGAATALVLGPLAAGAVVALGSAVIAIWLSVASCLGSTLFTTRIRCSKPRHPTARSFHLWHGIMEGYKTSLSNGPLLSCFLLRGSGVMLSSIMAPAYLWYALHRLAFTPEALGAVASIGAVGALVGSIAAGHWSPRLGIGNGLLMAQATTILGPLILVLADSHRGWSVTMFACAAILGSVGSTMTSVWLMSIRQVACPSRLLSRNCESEPDARSGRLDWGYRRRLPSRFNRVEEHSDTRRSREICGVRRSQIRALGEDSRLGDSRGRMTSTIGCCFHASRSGG